jgi:hypothetical protein
MARWHTTEFDMLPERAFQPRGGVGKFSSGMTLEGGGKGGGGSAPAPDPNIGIAQRELSELAKQQWEMFQTDIYPELRREAQAQLDSARKADDRADRMAGLADREQALMREQFDYARGVSEEQRGFARQDRQRYEAGAIPAMERLRDDANLYNTEAEQERLAGLAMGDITSQFENQRQQLAMRNQAFGIDPTSGASMGMQNANSVLQAAAGAAAMNQTRQAARDIGLQKQANVYNMYAGLPAQAATASGLGLNAMQVGNAASAQGFGAQGTAFNAGLGAFGAGQQAFGNFGAMGSSLGNAANVSGGMFGNMGQLGVGKYNADVGAFRAQQEASASRAGGFGSMLGSLGAAAITTKFGGSDIKIKENIVQIGKLNNGVNLYSYEYKPEYRDTWGHGRQIGVLAHEVEAVIPEAVAMHKDGYKMVDYSKVV